jgi:hypothetical protein
MSREQSSFLLSVSTAGITYVSRAVQVLTCLTEEKVSTRTLPCVSIAEAHVGALRVGGMCYIIGGRVVEPR